MLIKKSSHHWLTIISESKKTLVLAVPIMIGQVGQMMMGIIDSLMVGHIGAMPLAASAFANNLFNIILVFGIGTTSVLGPMIAKKYGERKKEDCGRLLFNGVCIALGFGLVLAIGVEFLSRVLSFFDQPADVSQEAKNYLRVCGVSIIPILIFQCYKQFLEALGKSAAPMILIAFALGVNALLNWIFIFGHLGAAEMGLLGAGWATLITRILLLIAMIAYVHPQGRFKAFHIFYSAKRISKKQIKKILRLGIPSGFQVLFEFSAFVLAAIMIGWIGTKELAAHQIALSISSITFMCALGLSFAAGLRVGHATGKQDLALARRIGFNALSIVVIFMGIFGIIFLLTNEFWPRLFILDPEVRELAAHLIIIAAVFQVFDGTQAVGIGILRGLLDIRVPTIITFFSYFVFTLPLSYFLAFKQNLGAVGVWLGLLGGLIVVSSLLTWRFYYRTKPPPKKF